jgi:hypothetical protein
VLENAKVACVLALAETCRIHVAVGRRWAFERLLGEEEVAEEEVGDDPPGRQGERRKGARVVDTVSMVWGDEATGPTLGKEWDEAMIRRGLLTMSAQSTSAVA